MQNSIKQLHSLGKTTKEISQELDISYKHAFYELSKLGLVTNKQIGIDENLFLHYYNLGYNDTKIAKFVNKTQGAVSGFRRKLNLPIKSTRIHDYDKVAEMCNAGLTYEEMEEKTGIAQGVLAAIVSRQKLNKVNYNLGQPKDITKIQLEFLFGCLLGDGCLHIAKDSINPRFSTAHSLAQKDYSFYKYQLLQSIDATYDEYYGKKIDKRTGKTYNSATVTVGASPSFVEFYNAFYSTGKKIIPIDLLEKYYTPFAMAIHFMDDGCGSIKSVSFCTNSFTKENLELFINFMKNKYNLEFTLISRNIIRLRAKSYMLFKELVYPYIIESMKYKFKT
jgi:hypothetical protein